ncbi:MAG: hypothetical protein ACR2PR_09035 [Pseudohongiellaceae bacterium]
MIAVIVRITDLDYTPARRRRKLRTKAPIDLTAGFADLVGAIRRGDAEGKAAALDLFVGDVIREVSRETGGRR